MTELEQAQEHLRACQASLYFARRSRPFHVSYPQHPRGLSTREFKVLCEAQVLAALSWVWDAQERASRIEPTAVWRVKGVGEKGELLLSIG